MEFPQIRDFDVFAQFHFESNNESERRGRDGTIIDMHDDDDEGLRAMLHENCLIDGALLESKVCDEYVHKLLVPSMTALFQTVERFAKSAYLLGMGWVGIAGWLLHVNALAVGQLTI